MKNGLYSIHVNLQDGRSGKGSGVVLFRDGQIEASGSPEELAGHLTTD